MQEIVIKKVEICLHRKLDSFNHPLKGIFLRYHLPLHFPHCNLFSVSFPYLQQAALADIPRYSQYIERSGCCMNLLMSVYHQQRAQIFLITHQSSSFRVELPNTLNLGRNWKVGLTTTISALLTRFFMCYFCLLLFVRKTGKIIQQRSHYL